MAIMAIRTKSTFKLFLYRLEAAWTILFSPKLHWILLSLDNEQFIKLFKQEGIELNFRYHRLQEYNFYDIVKRLAEQKDDIDMMLGKAEFEAEAEEYSKRNK